MNVRWTAVITGFVVDYLISTLLFILLDPDLTFISAPDLHVPAHLLLLCLAILSTGVGGYVAGQLAHSDRALNGLLVAVVGILLNQFGPPLPQLLVIASAANCLAAALGGALSRYPSSRQPRSSGQR
jgi:putative membrane protein (TIGR04086 family)